MILVDATVLYELGMIGQLDLLGAFDGEVVIPEAVRAEVGVEPARTNVERFLADNDVPDDAGGEAFETEARELLGVSETTSDVVLVAALLAARDAGREAALVSDDRRLRAVAHGLGATVTGTFGTVVRAAAQDKYFSAGQAKRVLRRTDQHGVQMTGELRERAIGEMG